MEPPTRFSGVVLPPLVRCGEPRVVVKNTFIEIVDMSPAGGASRRCSSTPARSEDGSPRRASNFEVAWGLRFIAAPSRGASSYGYGISGHSYGNAAAGTFNAIANKVGEALSCRRRSQSRAGSKTKNLNDGGLGVDAGLPFQLLQSDAQTNVDVEELPIASMPDNGAMGESSGATCEGETFLSHKPSFHVTVDCSPQMQSESAIDIGGCGSSPDLKRGSSTFAESDSLPIKTATAILHQFSSGRSGGLYCPHPVFQWPSPFQASFQKSTESFRAKRPSSCRGPTISSFSSPKERAARRAHGCGAAMARHRSSQPARTVDMLTPSS